MVEAASGHALLVSLGLTPARLSPSPTNLFAPRSAVQVCNGPALGLFTAAELELLICGLPHLDFDALEAAANYEGYTRWAGVGRSASMCMHTPPLPCKPALLSPADLTSFWLPVLTAYSPRWVQGRPRGALVLAGAAWLHPGTEARLAAGGRVAVERVGWRGQAKRKSLWRTNPSAGHPFHRQRIAAPHCQPCLT